MGAKVVVKQITQALHTHDVEVMQRSGVLLFREEHGSRQVLQYAGRQVLRYAVRHQWRKQNCAASPACATPVNALGA